MINLKCSAKFLIHKATGSFPLLFFRKAANTFRWAVQIQIWLMSKKEIRNYDAKIWKEGKRLSTDLYEKMDETGDKLIDAITSFAKPDERILDLCCNQGRFLLELRNRGFQKLFGFGIMESAVKKLYDNPKYNSEFIQVELCLAQDYFIQKNNNAFDWAITHGATIECIHPEFDIFKELSRTVQKGLVFLLNENGHKYPRFYRYLAQKNGFRVVSAKKIKHNHTLLVMIKP